jgi:hypothetical protein
MSQRPVAATGEAGEQSAVASGGAMREIAKSVKKPLSAGFRWPDFFEWNLRWPDGLADWGKWRSDWEG